LAAHVVGACWRSITRDDLCAPELAGGGLPGIQFSSLDLTLEQRRDVYSNWLLCKAFQELARGVRESLEAAHFYLKMLQTPEGPTTIAKLRSHISKIRERSQNAKFGQLLGQVNLGLREPLAFENEFLGLQRVRNCLEHRAGIVGERDIVAGESALILTFPYAKAFTVLDGKEIELPCGEIYDTHDINSPLWIGRERGVYIRRENVCRSFQLGERITIEMRDFSRIALACIIFANDLAAKLPSTAQKTRNYGDMELR
jgi:hypothetical protein